MKPLDLNFICQTLGLPVPSENQPVSRIVTDSRDIQEGDVFFALAGERFDAHDFVEDVLAAGATAVVVSREDCAALKGALKVDDTLAALQKLAKAWRENVNPFVFGITGSSGKTTVKEMLACVLRHRFGNEAVLATAGNFNNHIGLPLTLLKLNEKHRYSVIEMGMNHFGELSLLTQIAGPNVALVNNALRAHVGCGFDGVGDIAKAKSEIYEGLLSDGIALIPCEDANIATFEAATAQLNAQTFGVASGDVHAENIELKPLSCEFDLVRGNERVAVVLPVPGRHNVHNAVAAGAPGVGRGFGPRRVPGGPDGPRHAGGDRGSGSATWDQPTGRTGRRNGAPRPRRSSLRDHRSRAWRSWPGRRSSPGGVRPWRPRHRRARLTSRHSLAGIP